MQQIERDELQGYLNERIFATKRQKRSVSANAKLTQKQKDDLYQVVKDIRNLDMNDKVKDGEALDNALKTVATCLRQLNFHGMEPNPKDSKNIVPRDKMPFLIKQVLWLICYKALQAGWKREAGQKQKGVLTQKDVYEELENYGIYVSHNFFSSLELTPDYYLRCEEYSQPENPCKYMGQKKDELAVAIKNLVYQSGQHACFVDLFGGSGSASAAVCRKRRVKYVYNEINSRVCNYVEQIAGKNYKGMIVMLEKIQQDLRTPEISPMSGLGFSFQQELIAYISNKKTKDKYSQGVINAEDAIRKFGTGTYNFDVSSVKDILCKFDKALRDKKNMFPQDSEIQNITKDAMAKVSSILSSNNINQDFHFYIYELNHLCEDGIIYTFNYPYKVKMTPVPACFPRKEFTYEDYIQCISQYKALGYYAYFKNMEKPSEVIQNYPIECAVGEIFLKYMAVHGKEGSTAILDYVKQYYSHNAKNNVSNFIWEKFDLKVEMFHDVLSRISIANMDFREIIGNKDFFKKIFKDYSPEKYKILFYSDSPYIATSDYKEKFEADDMKDLVRGLLKNGADKNKFIFSMRAVKTAEDVEGKDKVSKIVKGNEEIYQYVYKEFESYKKPLYVLVIYEKSKDLSKLLQKSKVVEIMITNYEIVSFEIGKEGKEKYLCEVFTFKDYMKLIRGNMVGYQKDW